MTYRENAVPAIDKTEVEKEKIRQAGETKRARIAARKEVVDRMGDGFTVVIALLIVAVASSTMLLGHEYFDSKQPSTRPLSSSAPLSPSDLCRDEVIAFGPTGVVMRCNHPQQRAELRGENRLFCRCETHAEKKEQ